LGLLLNLLLEEDRTETRVKGADTFTFQDLGESTNQAIGKVWLGDETNTSSLERAKSNISKELSSSSGSQVDSSSVLRSSLITKLVDTLLLEEFVAAKLEGTLKEVTSERWANTSPNSAETFLSDNLSEATNKTSIIFNGIELYSGLDTVLGDRRALAEEAKH
jgi:hypothetical protein